MGSEPVEELPDDLEAWVEERAADDDTSRADVVRRLMAAHRLLDEHPDRLEGADVSDLGDGTAERADAAGPGIADLEARIDELAGRVGDLEADLDEKITDVRERVIQVKRDADAKAPADHDHPALERRVDDGFENYEEILEYLTERTEALEDAAEDRSAKLHRVANAVVDLRRRMAAVEGVLEEREAVAELRETANRQGISEAACGSCGKSVRLGLLEEPACPHCESPFDGVEAGGWFRSNRLTVGDRPALESGPARSDASSGHTGSTPTGRNGSGSEPPFDTPGSGPEGSDPEGRNPPSEAAGGADDVDSAPDADAGGVVDEPPDGSSDGEDGPDRADGGDHEGDGTEPEAEGGGADDR